MANKKMLLNNEMVVVLQKEEMSNNITIRTFLIKPQDLIVRQFQLQGLIGHHFKPTSPYLMIELREKLDQYNIGGTTPMVVQCLWVSSRPSSPLSSPPSSSLSFKINNLLKSQRWSSVQRHLCGGGFHLRTDQRGTTDRCLPSSAENSHQSATIHWKLRKLSPISENLPWLTSKPFRINIFICIK